MRYSLILLLVCLSLSGIGQIRIDSTFSFQTDTAKKYSLYIPSSYNAATPNCLMLGLHPFNTSRWWAESWCDTLIVFAETNGLILACPDGGTDGAIDDDIDTAFTTALLDSMKIWYNIDQEKTYIMGFSWGGQTTYTYGLRHISRFGGMLPIGSAMSGTSLVSSVLSNADSVPVYIVHGGSDSPSQRFTPIKDALTANGAILNSILMSGVGHTIDFPNRNQIITDAFQWIDSVNCSLIDTTSPPDTTMSIEVRHDRSFNVYPNPSSGEFIIDIQEVEAGAYRIRVLNNVGQLVYNSKKHLTAGQETLNLKLDPLESGTYILQIQSIGNSWSGAVMLVK